MSQANLAALCDQPGVRLTQNGALDVIEINNAQGSCQLTPFGATVLSYHPTADTTDWLWLSPQARMDGQKPVRGGIPVCWPWFADHPNPDASLPAHGLVRDRLWNVQAIDAQPNHTSVRLAVQDSADTRKHWPYAFKLELEVSVGATLSLSLTTHNCGEQPFAITEALHAYLRVADVQAASLHGLPNCAMFDKNAQQNGWHDGGVLALQGVIDRVYQTEQSGLQLSTPDQRRVWEKHGSASTIVWNPGAPGAQQLADMPDDAWREFVCIEAGNVLTHGLRLAPGQSHCLRLTLRGFQQAVD